MFEWLTLWPTNGPLPGRSQRNDIGKSSQKPGCRASPAPIRPPCQEGGRIEVRTDRVKPAPPAEYASIFSTEPTNFARARTVRRQPLANKHSTKSPPPD